jgi:hypothetical protein
MTSKFFHFRILIMALLSGFIFSCKEIGPQINLDGGGGGNNTGGNGDTSQQKIVLIEEFTAVRCTNCPERTCDCRKLLEADSGRIEVVEIHSVISRFHTMIRNPDFRSTEADQLQLTLVPYLFNLQQPLTEKFFPARQTG